MENLINRKVQDIEISGIRKFYNLASKYENIISLTLGQPDFPTPMHVKEAGKLAIDNNKTTYTPNAGLIELRLAACNYVFNKYALQYNPETEVIVTNGASEAIDIALRTILEPGSEVILPVPIYPGYEPIIKLMGGVPVYLDTRNNNFKIDPKLLAQKINSKTRLIIIPSPANPTGSVIDKSTLMEIGNLLRNKNIFVLSDEIYSELVYDEAHISIANIPNMKSKVIVINGLSKSHSMTGWRIGFTFAPEFITKNMLKVHQYNATCASTISQYAAIEALTNGYNDSYEMKTEYIKRRDYVYERLITMGLEVVKPSGAFYIFPSIKKFGMKSLDFALSLLHNTGVAVIPGEAFSVYGDDYIRISYAASLDILEKGLDGLQNFINSRELQK